MNLTFEEKGKESSSKLSKVEVIFLLFLILLSRMYRYERGNQPLLQSKSAIYIFYRWLLCRQCLPKQLCGSITYFFAAPLSNSL